MKMNEKTIKNFKCGYITIIGKPNVGKSTLMNNLIGKKISITSKKAQTTRNRILGIYNDDNSQIIFSDSPGIQNIKINPINNKLNKNAIKALKDTDLILFITESKDINQNDVSLLKYIPKNKPAILVINKSDKIKNDVDHIKIKKEIQNFNNKNIFNSYQIVSAKHHINLNNLIETIKLYLPFGQRIYTQNIITDKSILFLSQEIIREKIYRYLVKELPYVLNVEIESFKKIKNIYEIYAIIIVNKTSQKSIVIGTNGQKLKKISTKARIDLEKLLNHKVFLNIWIKVKNNWIKDDIDF